jgi:membrane dipeptidase
MHFHSFFGDSIYHSRPVGRMLGDGGATLVAWAISTDSPWFDHRRTFQQTGDPPPGAARLFFERQLGRIKAHMAEQGLRPCLVPEDVDRAIAGEPRIVLALEGTTFIERVEDVEVAYDAGIRHVQLVHFTRSPLGDFQTAPPRHGGLTPLGQDVVRACNRLGMLIDLAHATPETVAGALATSRVPMVWSHGSVTAGPRPQPGLVVWRARQLPLTDARAIASAGGVVGLWVFTHDIGRTVDDYARRVLQLADWLGDEHVGFGTDINGLAHNFVLSTYSEVRQAVDLWLRNGVPEQRIRRIAGLNYARVLRQALAARQG